MSVILAVKDGDNIILSTDSQATRGGQRIQLVSPNLMKIWRVAGHPGLVMGCCGSLRDGNILATRDVWYDSLIDKANEPIDFKMVVREIVPEILNELTAHGRTSQTEDGMMMSSTVIFAKGGVCYSIDPDGCVNELVFDGEALSVGSGSDVALASYRVLEDLDCLTTKEKVIRAATQACMDENHCSLPLVVLETKDDNIEIFDGVELYSMFEDEEDENEIEGKKEA